MEAVLEIRHAGCYTSRLTLDHGIRIVALTGHATSEGSVGLWEMSGADASLPAALRELASHPNIVRAEVLQKRPGAWILETVDREAGVSNALIRAGLVFLPPVVIARGTETYRVFAMRRAQVDAAVRSLSPPNEVRVRSLTERLTGVGALAELSAKQRDALTLAVREGYYERPKRTDLERLARTLRVSRPALAERLQRAEGKVLGALTGA